MITLQKDTDVMVLDRLDDKSLASMCSVNPRFRNLCNDDLFWKRRIQLIFRDKADEVLSSKFEGETYKQFYTSKRFQNYKNKIYPLCVEIQKLPRRSQLVLDDLYSEGGFLRTMIKLGIHDDYFDFNVIKLAYNRLVRENNLKEAEKYELLLNNLKGTIFDAYGFLPELSWDKEDTEYMRHILEDEITRIELLKYLGVNKPDFLRSLKNPAESVKIITTIHNGLKTGKIPLDIKWDEICTFPHMLNELVF